MKEIKETKLVETTITKITYQSDDGNCISEDRGKVELYEAHQKSKLMSIDSFYLPERSNMYYIIKINSRDDLLFTRIPINLQEYILIGLKSMTFQKK